MAGAAVETVELEEDAQVRLPQLQRKACTTPRVNLSVNEGALPAPPQQPVPVLRRLDAGRCCRNPISVPKMLLVQIAY